MKSPTIIFLASLLGSPGLLAAALVTFDSGSTGADGDLIVGTDPDEDGIYSCAVPGTTNTVDVGTTGVMNYSSVIVGADCILKFTPTGNSAVNSSKPVRILSTGDITIDGEINLDGEVGANGGPSTVALGGIGGPGGYDGGATGIPGLPSQAGFGPGGGNGVVLNEDFNCDTWGGPGTVKPDEPDPRFQPLMGGSGGGGGCSYRVGTSSGSGGGGALLIASDGVVRVNGIISALGMAAGTQAHNFKGGGAGANGVISIIATTISGAGSLSAYKIITESTDHQHTFTKSGTFYQLGLQRLALDLDQTPTLTISQVGGINITGGGVTSLGTAGDTEVTMASTGLSEGTEVTIAVTGDTHVVIEGVATLDADGNAAVTVAIPSGISVLTAYVSQTILEIAGLPTFGDEKIMLARLETRPGSRSTLNFYTESGKRVPDGFIKSPWQYVDFGRS